MWCLCAMDTWRRVYRKSINNLWKNQLGNIEIQEWMLPGHVVHPCNPSDVGVWGRRIKFKVNLSISLRSCLKIKNKTCWNVAQWIYNPEFNPQCHKKKNCKFLLICTSKYLIESFTMSIKMNIHCVNTEIRLQDKNDLMVHLRGTG